MAKLSKKDMDKLTYLWKDENKIEWIQTFLKIVDKSGKTVPFKLTQEQKDFVDGLDLENIVDKTRQLGISSVVIGLAIRLCVVKPNSSCLLASHDQKSCNAIFDKLKSQFASLPDFIKPKTIANNRAEIKMVNGSTITCSVAGNNDLCRGNTLQFCHLSELAFWKNASKHLNSITQAMGTDSTLIIESTPNGVNLFHDLYMGAKNKENSFKCFYYNWINGGQLFTKKYIEAMQRYHAVHNKDLEQTDLDEEELDLQKIGATLRQLTWRRMTISKTSLEQFHQEYSSYDTEGFLLSGDSVFDSKRVNEALMALKINKTKHLPIKAITDLPIILKQHYGKSFFMWDIPKYGEHYSIGMDASEGLGQDSHCIEVFDSNMVQVAEFINNKIKPWLMAEILDCIGRYYNKGLICVERASGGLSILARMRADFHYMGLVKFKSFDNFNKIVWNLGFDTNLKTKSLVVNDFLEMFDKRLMVIKSERILQEMQVFVSHDNGSMGALVGSHDDTIMSVCMAIVSHKSKVHYKW
ncbi:terminase [Clostridium estertheticum]|nr:terminase large subunit [Clostridium estertheticum]MBW9169754.1 terminase [Clostridium estertheticum]WLC74740.1 terminase [Clostridium estertheticum]